MRLRMTGWVVLTMCASFCSVAGAQSVQRPKEAADLINADRPGIADGPGIVSRGQLQVEVGFQRDYNGGLSTGTHVSFFPTLLRIGASRRLEFRLETNSYTWGRLEESAEAGRLVGWQPVSAGVKLQFCTGCALPIAVIGRFFPRSGSGAFSSPAVAGDIRLAIEVDLSESVSLNPNVGVAKYQGADGKGLVAGLLAATLTLRPSERVLPFVDFGFQAPGSSSEQATFLLDAGVAYIAGRHVQLDLSAGANLVGPVPRPFVSFGLSLRTPR
jgi:hypothetical protein